MNNNFDNKLTVILSNNQTANIYVLDIIESHVYNKTFIIYRLEDNLKDVHAAVLSEYHDYYSLETIKNKDELNYINNEINRVCLGVKNGL